MSKRLERIEADLARAHAKRETWDQRVKELEQKYTEEENTEIHEVVRSFNLTPEELREFLQSRRNNASAKLPEAEPAKESTATEQEADYEEA
jgi:pyruvate/oxaloacetate carboxyltransferase